MPKRKYKDREEFFATLKSEKMETEAIDIAEVDVLMLRNDPSIDAETPWAMEVGVLFGREAVKRGVIVLNDPDSLGRAINKLYFQGFPIEARAETLITKHEADIKAFAKEHQGNIILKPLQGSGGSGVFKLEASQKTNLNQIIEAIGRDGYVIAQAYVPAAKKGDIRLFLMNGHPLKIGGKYAALRRVASPDDIRSNIHAGGKAEAVEIGETELRVAELIRPKLVADGMFLVGIDIVGDKILEVNVFSPGNLASCSRLAGVDFSVPIVEAIERKVAISGQYAQSFDNRRLAAL
jgi:glutathione synthase